MNRRSFFSKVATAIAIVALAPEIAFRTRRLFDATKSQIVLSETDGIRYIIPHPTKIKWEQWANEKPGEIDWSQPQVRKEWVEATQSATPERSDSYKKFMALKYQDVIP